jgi:NAD(P)-dependent dehydrogenase (short-subunit alcohol dehydrogenase family)
MIFFITGGSRGIGAAVVRDVLAAGHDVAFTYVAHKDKADEQVAWARENAPERACRAYKLDISDSAAVERVADLVLDDFETVDVVVNSAALNRAGLAASLSDEDWHAVLDTNLSGCFYVCRQFLPAFLSNKRGRFIHISSIASTGMAGQIAYAASKAGLNGLSTTLAKEYGRKGITSNVLKLGFFDTDMTREQMPAWAKDFWFKFCPAGRMGEMHEVSGTVLYLASEAGGFINGETISLLGGLTWAP